jgi:acyl carrier protein
MNTQDAIERFVLDADATGKRRTKIDPDESLIGNGILDSMALLQLVVFLEERFGITVEDGELIPDNFETINRIQAFMERKRQGH